MAASSSRSDAGAAGGSRRGDLPYAAVDGAVDTAWRSAFAPDERAWWRLDLEEPRDLTEVTVRAPSDLGDAGEVVRVRTANGVTEPVRLSASGSRRILLPAR